MATTVIRHPAVAGQFYPRSRQALLAEIESYFVPDAQTRPALGCISPHAGYMYSGHVAGAVYSQIQIPPRAILLCPNHTGLGHALSIMSEGAWETPLGSVLIDAELAESLRNECSSLVEDRDAHRSEHAIEVQLPFLQTLRPELKIVPIAIGTSDFDVLRGLGEALAAVIADHDEKDRHEKDRHGEDRHGKDQKEERPEKVLIIASSDMNHYESDAITRVKDHKAIERVLALDARGLWEVVMNEDISMCGFGPTIAMLTTAKLLGATSATLVKYATSGDVSGDYNSVVGYAGIIVE